MLLSSAVTGAASSAVYTKVFIVFGVFWLVVLIVLFVGVGALMKRRERILRAQHSHPPGASH